jgi:hypothetical protein
LINDFCFFDENRIGIALNNFKVRVFDLRKNLNIPMTDLTEDCMKIAGNEEFLALGLKNGFVKLF